MPNNELPAVLPYDAMTVVDDVSDLGRVAGRTAMTEVDDVRSLGRVSGRTGITAVFSEGVHPSVWLAKDNEGRYDFTARTEVLPLRSRLIRVADAMMQALQTATGVNSGVLHEGETFYDHSKYDKPTRIATLFTATITDMPKATGLERYDLRGLQDDYRSQEFRDERFTDSFLTILELAVDNYNDHRRRSHKRMIDAGLLYISE